MPRIREIQIDQREPSSLQPGGAQGDAFGAQSGVASQQLGQSIGQVGDVLVKRAEQEEVSDTNAKLSKLHADATEAWQETLRTADPADKTVTQKFMDDYNAKVGEIQEGLVTNAGQKFFNSHTAEMGAQFQERMYSTKAALAGAKAKQDYDTSLSNDTFALQKDPGTFHLVAKRNSDFLDNLVESGGISRAEAAEMKAKGLKDLGQNAVRGWIDLDPHDAEKQLKDPKQWAGIVDGDMRHQLLAEARQAIRSEEIENNRLKIEQEKLQKVAQEAKATELLAGIYDGSGRTDRKAILKSGLPGFGENSQNTLFNILEARNKEGGVLKGDPSAEHQAFLDIHRPYGDPKKITSNDQLLQLVAQKKVGLDGPGGFKFLQKELAGNGTPAGASSSRNKAAMLATAYAELAQPDKSTKIADPLGLATYEEWLVDFQRYWDRAIESGVNPADLVDKKSDEYLGDMYVDYRRDYREKMKSQIEIIRQKPKGLADINMPVAQSGATPVLASPTAARLPGETPSEWRKRTKGK